jgi:hypothetical protein
VRNFVVYIIKYLGGPVGGYNPAAAVAAGLLVAAAFALLAFRLRALFRDPAYLFPLVVGLHTIGVGVISASGRAWMGSDQALTSRYATIAIPIWCATAALAMLLVRSRPAAPRLDVQRAGFAAALLAMLAAAGVTGERGLAQARTRSHFLSAARRGLIADESDMMVRLYPDPVLVKQRRAILRRLGISVFRGQR